MLPDLRFIFGAALGAIVLSVTIFGIATSIRLAQETRMAGPLDGSRPLAYTMPDEFGAPFAQRPGEAARAPGGPFAKVPLGDSATAQAPQPLEASATTTSDATTTSPEATAGEPIDPHAAVDERAVVHPPLSPTGEVLPETEDASSGLATRADEPPAYAEQQADITGSLPAATATAEPQAEPAPDGVAPAKAKKAARKKTVKAKRRAGTVIPPTASTGYPVLMPRTSNNTSNNIRPNPFPFLD
jgi:hypothetical protein